MTFDVQLTPQSIKQKAGSAVFQRGKSCYEQGQVHLKDVTADRIRAQVVDGKPYWVNLWENEGRLEGMCTCPESEEKPFCPHMVAVGLEASPRIPLKKVGKDWRDRLQGLLENVSRPKKQPQPYTVLFILRKKKEFGWVLRAYQLHQLGELRDAEQIARDIHETPPSPLAPNRYHLAPITRDTDIAHCLEGPLVAAFAQLVEEVADPDRQPQNLARWLEVITKEHEQVPLYLESTDQSLVHLDTQALEQAAFQVEISRQEDKVVLQGRLKSEQGLFLIERERVEIIAWGERIWILLENELMILEDDQIPIRVLHEWFEVPVVEIPEEEAEEVLLDYYSDIKEQGYWVGDLPVKKKTAGLTGKILQLREYRDGIQVDLYVRYGDQEIPYDPGAPSVLTRASAAEWSITEVQRVPKEEERIYRSISSVDHGLKYGTWQGENVFLLRSNVSPIEFLMEKLPVLQEHGFEVRGEDRLQRFRVNRVEPKLSLAVSSQIDWFDVQTIVEFGEIQVDFERVRRALKQGKKYIELNDGTVGAIPEDWQERYKHLVGMGERTEEGYRFHQYQLTLIDHILAQADQVQLDRAFDQRRQELLDFSGIEEKPLPRGFTGTLRPYQKAGYNWLHFLHEYRFGGILADDMGLGKTIETLALLQSLREKGHPDRASLLVLPRSLLINWQREAESFTPGLKVLIHHGRDRVVDPDVFDQYDLILTTYGTMRNDVLELRAYCFHYVILDESQAIKNPSTKTAKAVRVLQSDHRLALTGTPVENTTEELWSQFAFLNPGLLGSFSYFKREFSSPIENEGDQEAAELLKSIVYPFILRRTKAQVAPELPSRTERILYTDMEPAQKKIYQETRDYFRAKLLGMIERDGYDQARMNVLEGLLRLRQICNHPKLVQDDFQGRSAKMNLLMERVESLLSEGHKALIFSQFVEMLSLIKRELDELDIPYLYLDGRTKNRQERVDEFQRNPEIPLFLISLRAGGIGLNLTAADYVIHVDPWWNPAVESQATDRTHRIGQDQPVFVYKLIARDTVEEKILQLQSRKKQLVDSIITTEASFFKSLTKEDIEVLFS
jgi:non-specific serine/threonine protein kinase